VQTAALERVGHLARVVRGQDDERPVRGAQGAELGHRDLEVGEHLEQERLELGVGAIDLVDEQNAALRRADGAQKRPRQQEALGEEGVLLRRQLVDGVGERGGAGGDLADLVAQDLRVQELLRILPLVERLGFVEALVTLQADQLRRQRRGQRLGQLGLADAGRALDEDRLLHAVGEEDRGGDAAIAHIVVRAQSRDDVVDAGEGGRHRRNSSTTRAAAKPQRFGLATP
jgi:hypothetical protein